MDFVGREIELELLQSAWAAAGTGRPQVVALVGESRLGKTRIVQEFYHWLNGAQDPGDYWPDALPRTNDSLQVNPLFEAHEAADATPPWLWWGLRWVRPQQRNAAETTRCAVIADARALMPHVEVVRRQLERRRVERSAWVGVGKTALNLGTGGAVGSAVEVIERLQEWWELRKQRGEGSSGIEDAGRQQTDRQLRELQDLLLLVARSDQVAEGGVPLVLVLDDVHWADADSLRFLQQLLHALAAPGGSRRPRARLLVLLTAWEREWNEQAARTAIDPSADAAPSDFPAVLRAVAARLDPADAPVLSERRLGALGDRLAPLVGRELPGLTPAQRAVVAAKAGGSPGLLLELLVKLKQRSRHLFERADPKGRLTARGEQAVAGMTVSYHELVEERLQDLDDPTAGTLRVASVIGLAFSRGFTAELLEAGDDGAPGWSRQITEDALRRADRPLALTQPTTPHTDEFRLPIYQEILRRQYDESDDLQALVALRLRPALRHWLEARSDVVDFDEHWSVLSFGIQSLFAAVGAHGDPDDRALLLQALAEQNRIARAYGLHDFGRHVIEAWFRHWQAWDAGSSLAIGRERLGAILSSAIDHGRLDDGSRLADRCIELAQALPPGMERVRWLCLLLRSAGELARRAGRNDESLARFESYERLADAALAEFGQGVELLHERRLAAAGTGAALLARRDPAAIDAHERAVRDGALIVDAYDRDFRWRRALIDSKSKLALALKGLHRFDASIREHREVIALYDALQDETPETGIVDRRYGAATMLGSLGDAHLQAGEPEAASHALREAAERIESLLLEFPGMPSMQFGLAWARQLEGLALRRAGRSAQALVAAEAASRLRQALLLGEGVDDLRLFQVIQSREQVSELLVEAGRLLDGLVEARIAMLLRQRMLVQFGATPARIDNLLGAMQGIGGILMQMRDGASALAAYGQAADTAKRFLASHGAQADTLSHLMRAQAMQASLRLLRGEVDEALGAADEALATASRAAEAGADDIGHRGMVVSVRICRLGCLMRQQRWPESRDEAAAIEPEVESVAAGMPGVPIDHWRAVLAQARSSAAAA